MNKDELIAKRYKVVKLIGQGGMADVYLAHDVLLERDVAIKILRNELSNDAVSLLRFKHEAVAVSKLEHPNVIEIYDIGVHDSRQYIVMEYVSGQTLKQLINERGGLYKEEAVYIMKQLVSAINEAHKNEIIHRDIKPQNVLCKSDGSIIITDFGIALAENALHLTQKETVMGSVHYLAPELARGETATYQSDIYALGIVFYELLSGGVPFTGDTAVQIAMQHINKPIPSIKEFNPSIPQSIENIIIKSTFKNKNQRYKSASQMLEDLETVFADSRKNEAKIIPDAVVAADDTTKVISQLQSVETQETPKIKKSNRKRNVIIGSVIAVLLMFALFIAANSVKPVEEINVPDIIGLTLEEAREKLEEAGLIIGDIDRELDEELEENKIIKQSPRQNSLVDKGSEIDIIVSEGKYFIIENYVGRNYETVRLELENELKVTVRTEYIANAQLSPGEIYSQSLEAGSKINPNNALEIKFVVIKPREIVIPSSIYGMNINDAQNLLEEMGARVTLSAITDKSPEFVASQPKNKVDYTIPSRNSNYIQSGNSSIIIYYYEEVEKPKPEKPEPEKPEPEKPVEEEPVEEEPNEDKDGE